MDQRNEPMTSEGSENKLNIHEYLYLPLRIHLIRKHEYLWLSANSFCHGIETLVFVKLVTTIKDYYKPLTKEQK